MNTYDKLIKCYDSVRDKTDFEPRIALILGSGLGDFGSHVQVHSVVEYKDIEEFPVSTAPGHQGRFIFGHVKGVPVVVMQGRVHYYEGYSIHDVVLPVRLMGLLGAKVLFLTNAAGGVNLNFNPGDLMLIRDQIASFVPSPLVGPNIDKLGLRFPDMSRIYEPALCDIIRNTAAENSISLKEGVYIQFTGPQYESPAEIRFSRMLGADAVGMSTACEAIAARHMGIRVCGISCISNMAAGALNATLTHEEVTETGRLVAERFAKLVNYSIFSINQAISAEKQTIR